MKTIELRQGSPAWLTHRRTTRNASEAPVMRGEFPTFSRREFIRLRAVGLDREFSDYVRKYILDKGHEVEPALRALAESIIGEDLYPVTGKSDDDYLGASFDGVTLDESTILEAKQWSQAKAEYIERGEIPPMDYWQIVQQFDVCDSATRCLYLVGDGSEKGTVKLWIDRSQIEHDIPKLRASWEQFDADVVAYQPEPEAAPVPTGRAPDSLPALSIQVTGAVTASNLAEFKANALAVLGGINRDLKTDEDFANAEKTVKWCAGVEERLAATKQQVLGQTADIDAVFRTMDEVSAETRRIRLELDKLVTREKENRRLQIVTSGRDAYAAHVAELKAETKGVWLPLPEPDFAGAIKGKRTISSMQDAVDTALANSKIAANESAKHIRAALACLTEETAEHKHLFPDYLAFIGKPVDDIRALVRGRIAEHRAAEEARAEQLREKIRQEEAAKLVAAQAAEQAARDEEARKAAEPPVVAPMASVEAVATDAQSHTPVAAAPVPVAQQPAVTAQADALIKLGELNARIAPLAISAEGLTRLGFEPAGKGGAAKLYAESDLPHIYHAMAKVLEQAAKKGAS